MRRLEPSGCLLAAALVVTAIPAAAQPAPSPLHKGFVEAGLAYGYEMSNTPFIEVSNGTLLKSPHAGGGAIDLAGGYAIVPNLSIMGDLQRAHASTITGQNQNGDTSQTSVGYTSFTIGLRAVVPAGHGEIYAQMSVGFALAFDTELDQRMSNGDSRTTTTGYNRGNGGRGELGYHYRLNPKMFLAAGLRLQAFATNNVGRNRVRVDQPSGRTDTTTFSTDPNANNADRAETLSLQSMRIRIGFGVRF